MRRVFGKHLHHLKVAADKHQFREAMKLFVAHFGFSSVALQSYLRFEFFISFAVVARKSL